MRWFPPIIRRDEAWTFPNSCFPLSKDLLVRQMLFLVAGLCKMKADLLICMETEISGGGKQTKRSVPLDTHQTVGARLKLWLPHLAILISLTYPRWDCCATWQSDGYFHEEKTPNSGGGGEGETLQGHSETMWYAFLASHLQAVEEKTGSCTFNEAQAKWN